MNPQQYQEMKRLETQFKSGVDVTKEAETLFKQMNPDPVDWKKVQYYTDLINMSDAEKRKWYAKNISNMGNIGNEAQVARQVLEPVQTYVPQSERPENIAIKEKAKQKQIALQAERQKAVALLNQISSPEAPAGTREKAQAIIKKIQSGEDVEVTISPEAKRRLALKKELSLSDKTTSKLPFEKQYYENIDFGDNAGRTLYRILTPWTEEKGETAKSYIQAIPSMYTGEYETQERLKEQYEAEQSNPLWARILLGGSTVKFDEKNGQYIGIVAGEAPLITPAKGGVKLTQTIAVNYNKVLQQAKQAGLKNSWDDVLRALWRGEKVAGSRGVSQVQKINDITGLYRGYRPSAAQMKLIEKAVTDGRLPKILLVPPLRINPEKTTKEVIGIAKTLEPEKAISQLKETELLPSVIVSNPDVVTEIVKKIKPDNRSRVLTDIETSTQQAAEQSELTDTQLDNINKLIQKIRERTQAETETEAQEKAQEEAAARTQTEAQAQTQGRTGTHPGSRADIQTKPQAKTELQTYPATQTTTPTKTQQKTKPPTPDKKPVSGMPIPLPGTPPGRKLPPPKKDTPDVEKRAYILQQPNAVAWPQGEIKAGKVYHVVTYDDDGGNSKHFNVIGKAPEGTNMYRGPREAYQSITQISGRPPARPVTVEGGVVDPTIFKKPEGGPGLTFAHDKAASRRKSKPKSIPWGMAPDVIITRTRSGKIRRHVRRY